MTAQSTTPTLEALSRTITGRKVSQLRRDGQIPAVVYGHKKESVSLSLDSRIFTKLYREVGSTTLLTLTIDGKSPVKVLIHDVQLDPVTHSIDHVDLYQVNLKEKLRTEIPLHFVGTSDAVENEGGSLLTIKDAVEVECLPDDLVHEIEVDITVLKTLDDVIRVKDIAVPKGMTILSDEEDMIVSIAGPRSEADLEDLEGAVEDNVDQVASETGNEAAAEDTADNE